MSAAVPQEDCTMTDERCDTCDRVECRREESRQAERGFFDAPDGPRFVAGTGGPYLRLSDEANRIERDCDAHAVDWRERARIQSDRIAALEVIARAICDADPDAALSSIKVTLPGDRRLYLRSAAHVVLTADAQTSGDVAPAAASCAACGSRPGSLS